ncbi:MAG: cysteine hydrolase [Candidatus Aminicenantes bacterium]|nr:cysteine hydrolase [Candidatus Aminicenantes bacterium]
MTTKSKWKMIALITILIGMQANRLTAENTSETTALILIDIQDFYFEGARPLNNPEAAAGNAKKLLDLFRSEKRLVVHVRHQSDTLSEIHALVKPNADEKVITKNKVNAFEGTDLLPFLREHNVTHLVLCGMMTHMCLEAAVRAASDYGFKCTVIGDACTTRDLVYGGKTISADDVHLSTLCTLDRYYGRVISTEEYLNSLKEPTAQK